MYERILVCVANPKTQERLIELAGILSRTVQGELLPLHITLDQDSKPPDVLKEGTDALESDMLDDPETTIKRVTRIDASLHEGILHAATENQASIIFMGGLGKSRLRDAIFGSVVDQVVIKAHVPVLVGYLTSPMNAMKRVVLLALPRSAGLRSPAKAFEPALIISEALNLPVLVLTDSRHFHDVNEYIQSLNSDRIEGIHLLDHTTTRDILKITKSQDLLIYPLAGTVMRIRSSTGRLPKKLSDSLQVSLASIVYPVPPAEYRNAGSPYLRDWV